MSGHWNPLASSLPGQNGHLVVSGRVELVTEDVSVFRIVVDFPVEGVGSSEGEAGSASVVTSSVVVGLSVCSLLSVEVGLVAASVDVSVVGLVTAPVVLVAASVRVVSSWVEISVVGEVLVTVDVETVDSVDEASVGVTVDVSAV